METRLCDGTVVSGMPMLLCCKLAQLAGVDSYFNQPGSEPFKHVTSAQIMGRSMSS